MMDFGADFVKCLLNLFALISALDMVIVVVDFVSVLMAGMEQIAALHL
jgi:hypothetical protein